MESSSYISKGEKENQKVAEDREEQGYDTRIEKKEIHYYGPN